MQLRESIDSIARRNPIFFWFSALLTGATFGISALFGVLGFLGYEVMSPFELQSLSPAETYEAIGTGVSEITVGPYPINSVLTVTGTGQSDPSGGDPNSEKITDKPHVYVELIQDKSSCGPKALSYANPSTANDTMVASTVCTYVLRAKEQTKFTLLLTGHWNQSRSAKLQVNRRPCVECRSTGG